VLEVRRSPPPINAFSPEEKCKNAGKWGVRKTEQAALEVRAPIEFAKGRLSVKEPPLKAEKVVKNERNTLAPCVMLSLSLRSDIYHARLRFPLFLRPLLQFSCWGEKGSSLP